MLSVSLEEPVHYNFLSLQRGALSGVTTKLVGDIAHFNKCAIAGNNYWNSVSFCICIYFLLIPDVVINCWVQQCFPKNGKSLFLGKNG